MKPSPERAGISRPAVNPLRWRVWVAALIAMILVTPSGWARSYPKLGQPAPGTRILPQRADALPVFETRLHYMGEIWTAITNHGILGTEQRNRVAPKDRLALRIDYSPSFEFPAGSHSEYLYVGGLWFGGIIGLDTLVSLPVDGVSNTGVGELAGYDTISESSSLRGSVYYDPDARAEQQFYCRYSDTLIIGGTDRLEGRPHKPLNIEVSQTSYAWSNRFSRQFVIVECWIRNIGTRPIDKFTCGFFIDADVLNEKGTGAFNGAIDDISGILEFAPSLNNEDAWDPLYVAWVADNNGDPVNGTFPLFSPRGVVGIRILRAPPSERFSFNWWTGGTSRGNWGPVKASARAPQPQGGLGSPEGDRNAYYLMTNGEVDYNQQLAQLDHTAEGWRAPLRSGGCDLADGTDTRQILSVGPSCEPLYPGDSVPFVFAICGGDRLYDAGMPPFDCNDPSPYIENMDFSDLVFAATWAGWVYDTPGFDTDGDGYEGEYRSVEGAQVFFSGDLGPNPAPWASNCRTYGGAPDYAGPTGPSCPQPGSELFVESHPGELVVRWSGRRTETVPDPLTKKVDFEGYRLYVSRINVEGQYSLVASWDKVDYRWYSFTRGRWIANDTIFSDADLKDRFGADFQPQEYSVPSTGRCYRDTIDFHGFRVERCSYFEPVSANRGNTYLENGAEQVNVIQRIGDSVVIEGADTLRFGIYEARLTSLNPVYGYYVSVTAFDTGDPALNLNSLESRPGTCMEYAIPIYSADVVVDSGLKVAVYPNPYRAFFEDRDGNRTTYFEQGFEAPARRGAAMDERDRRIWFANLPPEATIRIYTLDGDLVRTIRHEWPRPEGVEGILTDYSSRAAWDLVSRNTQAVVSGIYIYHISSPYGSQTGKIVIIK